MNSSFFPLRSCNFLRYRDGISNFVTKNKNVRNISSRHFTEQNRDFCAAKVRKFSEITKKIPNFKVIKYLFYIRRRNPDRATTINQLKITLLTSFLASIRTDRIPVAA